MKLTSTKIDSMKLNHVKLYSILVALGALSMMSALSGCEYETVVEDQSQLRTLDGVKLITSDITDGEDTRTFSQYSYDLGPQRRLLLRFESLLAESDQVRTDDGRKVELGIGIPDATQAALAQQKIKVCPILNEWSMFCTWSRAHEEGHGKWQNEGGDYDHAACLTGTTQGDFLVFDVTTWFIRDVRGRGRNLGLIVLSDADITVAGDVDQTLAPQLRWTTTTQSQIPAWPSRH